MICTPPVFIFFFLPPPLMNYNKFISLYGQLSADFSILPPFGFIVFHYENKTDKNVCDDFANVLSMRTKCVVQQFGISLLKPILDVLRNDGPNDYSFGSTIFMFYLKDLEMALDPNLKELCKYAKQLKVRVLLFVDKEEKWPRRTDLLSWGDVKITSELVEGKSMYMAEIAPKKKGGEVSSLLLDVAGEILKIDEEKEDEEN